MFHACSAQERWALLLCNVRVCKLLWGSAACCHQEPVAPQCSLQGPGVNLCCQVQSFLVLLKAGGDGSRRALTALLSPVSALR